MHDEMGDRFKAIEREWRQELPRRGFVVIRVDGRAFHSWTRGLDKPFSRPFITAMDACARKLCEGFSGALSAYVQSDEISLVLTDLTGETTEPEFGWRLPKLISLAASEATAEFNRHWFDRPPATFDGRAFPLATVEDVADYLRWRQDDARRNAVSMLSHHWLGKKAVHGVGTRQRVDLLAEMGVIVDQQDRGFTQGRIVRPEKRMETVTYTRKDDGTEHAVEAERTHWVSEPSEFIRNWFYDNHADRFGVRVA
jgi:tRNA(His) guanylyltransferase